MVLRKRYRVFLIFGGRQARLAAICRINDKEYY